MRRTVASLTPSAAAIDRVLQCVAFGGVVRVVRSTIARTLASVRAERLRPPRGASLAMPLIPESRKRRRQRATACRRTPTSAAI